MRIFIVRECRVTNSKAAIQVFPKGVQIEVGPFETNSTVQIKSLTLEEAQEFFSAALNVIRHVKRMPKAEE